MTSSTITWRLHRGTGSNRRSKDRVREHPVCAGPLPLFGRRERSRVAPETSYRTVTLDALGPSFAPTTLTTPLPCSAQWSVDRRLRHWPFIDVLRPQQPSTSNVFPVALLYDGCSERRPTQPTGACHRVGAGKVCQTAGGVRWRHGELATVFIFLGANTWHRKSFLNSEAPAGPGFRYMIR